MYEDMRIAHAQEISELGLDGYAVGGLSVGETDNSGNGRLDNTPSAEEKFAI